MQKSCVHFSIFLCERLVVLLGLACSLQPPLCLQRALSVFLPSSPGPGNQRRKIPCWIGWSPPSDRFPELQKKTNGGLTLPFFHLAYKRTDALWLVACVSVLSWTAGFPLPSWTLRHGQTGALSTWASTWISVTREPLGFASFASCRPGTFLHVCYIGSSIWKFLMVKKRIWSHN